VTGRDRQAVIRAGAGLVILLLLVPLVSASIDSTTVIPVSRAPDAQDSQAVIASLKYHVAYVGMNQDARMDGVIRYIDAISGGTAGTGLQQIQDDYLVIASSIPLMKTNDEIASARDALRVQTQLFSEETKARMVQFNGSTADMRESIRSSTDTADKVIDRAKGALWLSSESARITLFLQDSVMRNVTLRNLTEQGIDTTIARNISDQINARRTGLQVALSNKSAAALKATNDEIKTLNRQFRENVASSRATLALDMKSRAMMART
jgi:hypothetical protein